MRTRLSSIDPEWTPNLPKARASLESKLGESEVQRPWLPIAASVAAAVLLICLPQSRALAQDLWFRMFLNHIDVVRVDWSKLPLDTHVTTHDGFRSVTNLNEAQANSGFEPTLPKLETLEKNPEIRVLGRFSISQQINVPRLQDALNQSGATDLRVPSDWHGQTLSMVVGPTVELNYKGGLQVLQARPIELRVPNGFPLAQFAELAFRSAGMSWWESRALAERFAKNPAWLLDVPTDEAALVQEINLHVGKGILVEDRDDVGKTESFTLLFQSPGRIYSVSGANRELCIQVANSLL